MEGAGWRGWGWGGLSAAIHLSSLMRSESCTNTDIDNIPSRTPLSSFHLSTSILCDACQSHICTSVQAARHTPAVTTSKTSLPSLNASFIWPMLHSFKMNCMDAVWRRERKKKRRANKGGDHSVCLICQRHRRRAVKTTSECLGCEPS